MRATSISLPPPAGLQHDTAHRRRHVIPGHADIAFNFRFGTASPSRACSRGSAPSWTGTISIRPGMEIGGPPLSHRARSLVDALSEATLEIAVSHPSFPPPAARRMAVSSPHRGSGRGIRPINASIHKIDEHGASPNWSNWPASTSAPWRNCCMLSTPTRTRDPARLVRFAVSALPEAGLFLRARQCGGVRRSRLSLPHSCTCRPTGSILSWMPACCRRNGNSWPESSNAHPRAHPRAYLTHEAWLQGYRFYVDQRVIVPGSFLAPLILEHLHRLGWRTRKGVLRAVDLCTRSGCLAILLAESLPDAAVDAVDLSADALDVRASQRPGIRLGGPPAPAEGICSRPWANAPMDPIVAKPPLC